MLIQWVKMLTNSNHFFPTFKGFHPVTTEINTNNIIMAVLEKKTEVEVVKVEHVKIHLVLDYFIINKCQV